MKFKYMVLFTVTTLLLTACGNNNDKTNSGSINDGESSNESNALEHGVSDQSDVGYEMAGGNIEEAKDVPKKERQAIIAAFDTYMTAFNEEDIETYMSVIAKDPEGFEYDQEETLVKETFAEYQVNRTAEDVTLIKYDKNQAQVFATLNISMEQEETGAKLDRSGRQVTVFAKEDGQWRVTSVFFIGDPAE
ncbi:MAG: nuclear transport factor 2 family protein [Paenisporosarcina sp.]